MNDLFQVSELAEIENHPDTCLTIEELDDFLEYTSNDDVYFGVQESLHKYKQENTNRKVILGQLSYSYWKRKLN